MKYKVIGWTEYDDSQIKDGDCTVAAYRAIIEDIRAHGYCFSGYAHQEYFNGAPVLNDGKKRTLSQRGWGGLMAEAHGETDPMAYSLYAFQFRSRDAEKMPPNDRSISKSEAKRKSFPTSELREDFACTVPPAVLDRVSTELCYYCYDEGTQQYAETGDTLTLSDGERTVTFAITDVKRAKDKNNGEGEIDPIRLDEIAKMTFLGTEEEKKLAHVYHASKPILVFSLKQL